jgi:IclR family transcriptional regulator, acetate operon repressor
VTKDVPAVSATIRIVERLRAEWPAGVAAGELSRSMGINRSTCYNLLHTLARAGWVASGGRGWTLGPGLLHVAQVPAQRVAVAIQEHLEPLARDLGAVVFAVECCADGRFLVVSKADPGASAVRVTVDVGEAFPPAAPAMMRACTAWLGEEELAAWLAVRPPEPFTPLTIVDPGALRAELARVRTRGYAISLEEYGLGQSGVAAPIFDERGGARTALCTLGFSTDLHAGTVDAVGARLRETAHTVTMQTGGRWPAADE